MGCQKLGQPVPDSNLVSELYKAVPQQMQRNRPWSCSGIVRTAERPLGAGMTRHLKGGGRQLGAPLGIGLDDLVDQHRTLVHTGIGEHHDA